MITTGSTAIPAQTQEETTRDTRQYLGAKPLSLLPPGGLLARSKPGRLPSQSKGTLIPPKYIKNRKSPTYPMEEGRATPSTLHPFAVHLVTAGEGRLYCPSRGGEVRWLANLPSFTPPPLTL